MSTGPGPNAMPPSAPLSPFQRKSIAAAVIFLASAYFGRYWWIRGVNYGDPRAQAMAALALWGAWGGMGMFTLDPVLFRRCARVAAVLLAATSMYGMYDMRRPWDFVIHLALFTLAGTHACLDFITRGDRKSVV